MFGNNNRPKSNFRTFFGTNGNASTVFNTSQHTFTVTGSNNRTNTYYKSGNMFLGSDGVHTVYGSGSLKTIVGPHGETTMVHENDHGGFAL